MRQRYRHKVVSSPARNKRFCPRMLAGLSVPAVLMIIASAVFILPHLGSHAAAVNGDCTLLVPPKPLSAQGVATPDQLVATNPEDGACNESNKAQAPFSQRAVIKPATGRSYIYNPLAIHQRSQPP